jgi:RNA polymerase sigma-70 factor, ECF subfamily
MERSYAPLRVGEIEGVNPEDGEVTALLAEFSKGKDEAASQLIPLVYAELRKLASGCMRRERPDHTLQPTALVHEAYIKLLQQRSFEWQSRAHFYAIAAKIMRRILVDHARAHLREKRGAGNRPIPLDGNLVFAPEQSEDLLNLNQALDQLGQLDPRQARIVELRFFAGLTVDEAAELMEISPKTVKRDWSMAKAWLHGELKAKP